MHYLIKVVGHHFLIEHFYCNLEILVVTINCSVNLAVLAKAKHLRFFVDDVVLPELLNALLSTASQLGETSCTGCRPGHVEAM